MVYAEIHALPPPLPTVHVFILTVIVYDVRALLQTLLKIYVLIQGFIQPCLENFKPYYTPAYSMFYFKPCQIRCFQYHVYFVYSSVNTLPSVYVSLHP